MIRVLIADDQSLVREAFRTMIELEADMEIVGEAGDGAEVLRLAREQKPDVILMDVRMPNLDGLEATERLMGQPHPPRVLMLTTFDRNEYLYRALKAGASGFLLKDARRSQLLRAIRSVASGDALVDPSITMRLIESFCRPPDPNSRFAALDELTERELEVLKLVARGLSNAEIAAAMHLAEATVKTHMARMLSKLGLRDRVQAVVLAYESALVLPGAIPRADPG
jgi:DNA-binding NarL/FixJ family response regulator